MEPTHDADFMQEAIRCGREGMGRNDGGPFGAVVVRGTEIVGRGWNRVLRDRDPTAHAEVVAIRDACRTVDHFSLAGCRIYSSCEPCPMCLATCYWARLDRLYYAATRLDAAKAGFDDSLFYDELVLLPEQRRLVTAQLELAEARELFDVWTSKPDRVPY